MRSFPRPHPACTHQPLVNPPWLPERPQNGRSCYPIAALKPQTHRLQIALSRFQKQKICMSLVLMHCFMLWVLVSLTICLFCYHTLLFLLFCSSIFHHLTRFTLHFHPALLVMFTLSTATTCSPPLCRSSQCVHASAALRANTVAFWWPCVQAHSGVPRAISAGPNCSLLFVFKVSILNKHVSCK